MRKLSILVTGLVLSVFAHAQTIVYSDNFDDKNISDWTLYDVDGDGYNWGDTFRKVDQYGNPTVDGALISSSWVGGVGGVHPDDWAVTPAINLSGYAGKPVYLFWTVESDINWPTETYAVYAATSNDVASLLASPVKFSETLQDGSIKKRTLDLSSFAGQTVYVAFRHYDSYDQDWIAIDNVQVKVYPSDAPPACPVLVSPADNATGLAYLPEITFNWNASAEAESYDIYMGTDPSALELVVADYTATELYGNGFEANTKYYWKVIAKDPLGGSVGCTAFNFTTGASPVAPYCGPLLFGYGVYGNDYGAVEPITMVDFAGLHNETSNVVDGSPAHEVFLDKTANVVAGNTYTFTIKGNTNGIYTNYYAVYIDWNQNGVFDENETYFDLNKTLFNSSGEDGVESTLDIAVPATAKSGTTRMRVKKIYTTSPTKAGWYLPDACESHSEFGQAEEYSVAVSVLGTSDLSSDKVAVKYYPNPVRDVLSISSERSIKGIKVYDAAGREVLTKDIAIAKETAVNLSSLTNGTYVVVLSFENGTQSIKVLKN